MLHFTLPTLAGYYDRLHYVPSQNNNIRCSTVVSIPACHAGDPGSIPGAGAFLRVWSRENVVTDRMWYSMANL